jgi:hypothetical protein
MRPCQSLAADRRLTILRLLAVQADQTPTLALLKSQLRVLGYVASSAELVGDVARLEKRRLVARVKVSETPSVWLTQSGLLAAFGVTKLSDVGHKTNWRATLARAAGSPWIEDHSHAPAPPGHLPPPMALRAQARHRAPR